MGFQRWVLWNLGFKARHCEKMGERRKKVVGGRAKTEQEKSNKEEKKCLSLGKV